MNRFSHYLRDIIDWYVWKLKMQKLNADYNKFNYTTYDMEYTLMIRILRYNRRDLASYAHIDSDKIGQDSSFIATTHDIRMVGPLRPIRLNIRRLDGKSCRDVVLPIRYRYSSGYEHQNAYKDISRFPTYHYTDI